MPPGKRPAPRVEMTRDPVMGERYTRYDEGRRAREVESGDVRVAVGDKGLARLREGGRRPEPRTPTPAATRPAPAPAPARDALKDGRDALMNNRERLQRQEEEAMGGKRQNYAAGGYVTKAQTLNMPACSKGKKRK